MAWNNITDWMVRHLAAINHQLMSYIQGDLDWLKKNRELDRVIYSGDAPVPESIAADNAWHWGSMAGGHKTGNVWVPDTATTIQIVYEYKVAAGAAGHGPQLRIRLENDGTGDGWDYSEIESLTADGDYHLDSVAIALNGNNAWRKFEVGYKQNADGQGAQTFIMKSITFKVLYVE